MKAISPSYHSPVMAPEAVSALKLSPSGVYVDATYGGGGHSRLILDQLGPEGRVLAFDRDADAWTNMPKDERLLAVHHDFTFMEQFMRYAGYTRVDGILADLGVSSHQFDTGERGFSFRYEGPLDMRMDTQSETSAASLLAEANDKTLASILARYGDVEHPGKVARHLVAFRNRKAIQSTADLTEALEELVSQPSRRHKYLARVFQALRIAVNQELEALQLLLAQSAGLLREGGRLVVISYHSAEDRLVKQYISTGKWQGGIDQDVYGRPMRPLKPLSRKPITPHEDELERNPRARSARLRIAEKTMTP